MWHGGVTQVWDSSTLQCLRTLEGHEDNVRVLAAGDRHLFSGSWDKTIRVWDLRTLTCLKVYLSLNCSQQLTVWQICCSRGCALSSAALAVRRVSHDLLAAV